MPSFFRSRLRFSLLFALCLCVPVFFGPAASRCAAATTYYVSTTGSDTNAGTLAAPFRTIQHGISTASSGDTVIAEDGTYTGPGNVDLDFGGRNLTVTSQNGAAKTIIDCGGSSSANHRGFYLHSGEISAVISGFTIQHGYESSSKSGGGVCCYSAVNVSNCVFLNNYATYGGGIEKYSTALCSVTHCTFTGNSAFEGGALYLYNTPGGATAVTNCDISGNKAISGGSSGGGIFIENEKGTETASGGVTAVTNCTLTGNRATDTGGTGGAISAYNWSAEGTNYGGVTTVTDCTLAGNQASSGGGILDVNYSNFATTFLNTIVFGDTGGEIINGSANTLTVVASHCDVQGGYAGTSNLNADPQFVTPPNLGALPNLRLQPSSPCIGAGTAVGTPRTDIEGRIRPDPPSLGAYEAGTPVSGSDDFFIVTSENSGSNTVGEYTPTGNYVRTITVPGNTGASAQYGTEYLRGIAATDSGQLVGFNGTGSPDLTRYHPDTLTFTAQTFSGWGIANNVSSGSVGVYQGYTFAVNETPNIAGVYSAIIRFNSDGTSQQFAYNTGYTNPYINLAVGMDGKLYALLANPAGGPNSAWALDVYDPVSLTKLRTISLQVPDARGSQATSLRNFAVDAQGGIYAIELYSYVYHLDSHGTLLQTALPDQNGDAADIKIDPVSGNLLIGLSGYSGGVIQTDPLLSSFQRLVTLSRNYPAAGFVTFSNAKLAAALIGPPRLTATAGPGSVSLQWTDPAGVAGATYSVYRGTTPGGETLYQSGITATNYADTAVTPGTPYYYTVQTVLSSQTSPLSNEVSATPTAPILGKVRFFPRLSWESRMVGGQFQGSHDGVTWTTLYTVTTKPADAWTDGPVTAADPKTFRFLRYLSPNGGYGNVAEIEFYTGTGTSAVKLTGAAFGTAGSYKNNGSTYLKALDGSTATFFDQGTPDGVFVGFDQTPPPAAPTGLTATGGLAQITLSWTASPGATRYILYRGTTPGGEGTRIYKTGLAGTSYADTAVTPGATYYYLVRAINSNGGSPASNEAHASVGILSGSSAAITSSQAINLTALGTADWAHWGLNGVHGSTPGEFDHKAASGAAPVGSISPYTVIGSGKAVSYPTTLVNCTWTGGTPTPSATTSSEVYLNGTGSGFRLTIPADTTQRTLTLYVGGYNSLATLTAHLSDGSAVDFTDSTYGYNRPGSTDGAHYQAVYTLTYGAASAGQTLTVSWVQTAGAATGGNVTLQAAALAAAGP